MNVKDITFEIMASYATACRDLQAEIARLGVEGYDMLVVPSRGAHPFLEAARAFDKLRPGVDWRQVYESPFYRMGELYLPFTADCEDDGPISSGDIRGYWSRMLAAMIRKDAQEPAYRLHEFLRARAGRLAIGDNRIPSDSTGRFIFVDTVLSGRAISEIFTAFERHGLTDCHFVLLVDECGRGLKPAYAASIRRMVSANRATVINLEKIFTEDQGPAMSGIWTVSFPELMAEARRRIPELAESGETGAGLFYHEVSRRTDDSNLDYTMAIGMLGTLINSATVWGDTNTARRFLDRFRDHMIERKLQQRDMTKLIAEPKIRENISSIESLDVSGSHVIRVRLAKGRAKTLIDEFLKS